MKKNRFLLIPFLLIAMACFLGMSSPASASLINGGFDSSGSYDGSAPTLGEWTLQDIDGWNFDAPTVAGIWNPADNGNLYSSTVGDVAYIGSGVIYQEVGVVTAGSYTLTGELGTRFGFSSGLTYSLIAKDSGGHNTYFASGYGDATPGSFIDFTLNATVDATSSLLGQALYVAFRQSGTNQINLDNVSLSGTATMHNPIPAPILLLGTGLVGLAGFRRKLKK